MAFAGGSASRRHDQEQVDRHPDGARLSPLSSMPAPATPIVDNVYNTHERVRIVAQACKEVREGVGPNGDWNIDLHQKFDYPDALRCCKLIEGSKPYLVEGQVRDEQFLQDIPRLRQMTTCPLAAGEEWGPTMGLQPPGGEPRHRLHSVVVGSCTGSSMVMVVFLSH